MKNICRFLEVLTLLSLPIFFGPTAYAQSSDKPTVVLYDEPNFQGRSMSFGPGKYRLFDFNDLASSIKVSKGLVAIVYEHSDEGGGYGEWVDFLEDQPDLRKYGFDNKISHLAVFASERPGLVYERNNIEDGRFVPGHWNSRQESPVNSNPVIGPSMPPNVPEITSFQAEPNLIRQGQSTTLRWQTANAERVMIGERYPGSPEDAGPKSITWQGAVDPSGFSRKDPARATVYVLRAEKGDQSTSKTVFVNVGPAPPTFCSVAVRILGNKPSYHTLVEIRRADTNEVIQRERVPFIEFRFDRLPVGTYKIVPKATGFPAENGRPTNFGFLPAGASITCRQNMPLPLSREFRVHSFAEGE
jgi:hypothetical protein